MLDQEAAIIKIFERAILFEKFKNLYWTYYRRCLAAASPPHAANEVIFLP